MDEAPLGFTFSLPRAGLAREMDQLLRKESEIEQAIRPGHERTKDLVKDQSPVLSIGQTVKDEQGIEATYI